MLIECASACRGIRWWNWTSCGRSSGFFVTIVGGAGRVFGVNDNFLVRVSESSPLSELISEALREARSQKGGISDVTLRSFGRVVLQVPGEAGRPIVWRNGDAKRSRWTMDGHRIPCRKIGARAPGGVRRGFGRGNSFYDDDELHSAEAMGRLPLMRHCWFPLLLRSGEPMARTGCERGDVGQTFPAAERH